MVILTIKIWVIWISRTFLVSVYLSICNFPYFLTDKQKTKKVREIQITQILTVSSTISYIFCALKVSWQKGPVRFTIFRIPNFFFRYVSGRVAKCWVDPVISITYFTFVAMPRITIIGLTWDFRIGVTKMSYLTFYNATAVRCWGDMRIQPLYICRAPSRRCHRMYWAPKKC